MPTFRLALAATAAAAIAVSGCTSGGGENNQSANPANAAGQAEVPKLPIPIPEPPLGRERLLVAAMQAATDFAAGTDDGDRQKQLANKKFEVRIRFGCEGPSPSGPPALGWSLNEKTGTLKLKATPALSPKDEPVAHIAGEAFEAVEGFWVRRPWMLSAACPRAAKPADAEAGATATEQPQTPAEARWRPDQLVGIAQFFTATAPRTMRRSGRPYEATKRLEEGDRPNGGFDLILAGRLVPLPNGRVIACTGEPGDGRPACIVSVEFGKVSIERADTHEQIAQWGTG